MKALRLLQTLRKRDREEGKDDIQGQGTSLEPLLVDESLQLFGCRQLVNLLEFQRQKKTDKFTFMAVQKNLLVTEKGISTRSWVAAIAFCLAMAGMGFAIGCTYLS
ncbi:Unknown protein [Striga hermonthica]|uniref:Uncharacterized protein n=1 Tax=Striga hermonthica TaxID=68872 RepID=A0A9N7MPX8_STRHE|nr:Unknown protein [Striga hermonthica]